MRLHLLYPFTDKSSWCRLVPGVRGYEVTLSFCVSGASGGSVLWPDSPGGGSSAKDCGEGRSHYLHWEGGGRGGGDAPRTHGQERTQPSFERWTVLLSSVNVVLLFVCESVNIPPDLGLSVHITSRVRRGRNCLHALWVQSMSRNDVYLLEGFNSFISWHRTESLRL